MLLSGFIYIVLSTFALLLNTFSVVVFLSSTELRGSTFNKLVLTLSISDILFLVESIVNIIFHEFNPGLNLTFDYACVVLINLTGGTYVFSTYQCFLICIERLNATFVTESKHIKRITSNKGCMFGCFAIHMISVVQITIDIFQFQSDSHGCKSRASNDVIGLLVRIPVALICISIVIVYTITLLRIYRVHQNQPGSPNSDSQIQRMHKAIKTVGVLIVVMLIAYGPACVVYLYSVLKNETYSWIGYCNALLVLNPLLDPFIYLFCMNDFRSLVKKKLHCV